MLTPLSGAFRVFDTISQDNDELIIIAYDEVSGEQKSTEADSINKVMYYDEYGEEFDSLRLEVSRVLIYCDGAGYYNLRMDFPVRVDKAIPDYTAPETVFATSGQSLSEIELPEGFSWMDETEVFEGPSESHLAKFTPDDTGNYEIIENIPIMVTYLDLVKVSPNFEVDDVYIDGASQMITDNINVSVTNLEPEDYTISDLFYQLIWEDDIHVRYVDITFTLELTDEALERYYLDGSVTKKQFTIRTDVLVRKATPYFVAPEIVFANSGQSLSEIELPEGFSWMDETEIFGGSLETHLAKFTPDDTYYYEIVENIPVSVVSAQLTEIIPSFKIEDIFDDDGHLSSITNDTITVVNLEPDDYSIFNLFYQEVWEDTQRCVDITFTLELTDKALEHYYLDGPAIRKQFTVRANVLVHKSVPDYAAPGIIFATSGQTLS